MSFGLENFSVGGLAAGLAAILGVWGLLDQAIIQRRANLRRHAAELEQLELQNLKLRRELNIVQPDPEAGTTSPPQKRPGTLASELLWSVASVFFGFVALVYLITLVFPSDPDFTWRGIGVVVIYAVLTRIAVWQAALARAARYGTNSERDVDRAYWRL